MWTSGTECAKRAKVWDASEARAEGWDDGAPYRVNGGEPGQFAEGFVGIVGTRRIGVSDRGGGGRDQDGWKHWIWKERSSGIRNASGSVKGRTGLES